MPLTAPARTPRMQQRLRTAAAAHSGRSAGGGLLLGIALALHGCAPPPPGGDAQPQAGPAAPAARTAPAPQAAASARTTPVAAQPGLAAPLAALDELSERPAPAGVRNPFRFPAAPDTGGPAPQAAAAPERTAGEPLAEATRIVPGAANPPGPGAGPAAPAADALALRVIGVVDAPAGVGRVAVVTDGRSVLHGRPNDVLQGRYRVVAIDEASVTIEPLPDGSRQTLPRPDPHGAPAGGRP